MKNFILFDFDGTLVDSQILYDICASESLLKVNPKYNLQYCIEYFNGRGWHDVFKEIAKTEDREKVENAFQEALKNAKILTEKEVRATENAISVLQRLKKEGLGIAICSNSSAKAINLHLQKVKMEEFFEKDAIFSLESVKNSKPAPDLYLKAMGYFNAKNHECLIVEDSISGLTSASLAKIDALFYKGASHHTKNSQNSQNVVATLNKIENTLKGEIFDLMEIFNYIK
jgi:HAD superfamily hydrolase (TIGR01509 family)